MPMLKKREDLTDFKDDQTNFALGLTDEFGDFLVVKEEKSYSEIDKEIEKVKKMDIDEETKIKVINEYNNLKNAKSPKESVKYKKIIKKLIEKGIYWNKFFFFKKKNCIVYLILGCVVFKYVKKICFHYERFNLYKWFFKRIHYARLWNGRRWMLLC